MRKLNNRFKKAIRAGVFVFTKIDNEDITYEFIQRSVCRTADECGMPDDIGIKAFIFYSGMSIVEVMYKVGDTGFRCHVLQDENRWHPSYTDVAFANILQDVERACKERGNGLIPLYEVDFEKGNLKIVLVRRNNNKKKLTD